MTTTRHARARMQQRGISNEAVEAAVSWGWEYRDGGGIEVAYLGKRAVQEAARRGADVGPYEGVALILSNGAIVTTYRAPRPMRFWRRIR